MWLMKLTLWNSEKVFLTSSPPSMLLTSRPWALLMHIFRLRGIHTCLMSSAWVSKVKPSTLHSSSLYNIYILLYYIKHIDRCVSTISTLTLNTILSVKALWVWEVQLLLSLELCCMHTVRVSHTPITYRSSEWIGCCIAITPLTYLTVIWQKIII